MRSAIAAASAFNDLDTRGYAVLAEHIAPGWRRALAERFDAIVAAEGPRAGSETGHGDPLVTGLGDLVNKGVEFDELWTDPVVLALAQHVIGRPFRLSSLNGREPRLGGGHQALHSDPGARSAEDGFHGVNSLWALDDMDGRNGATRLVPGTHVRTGWVHEHLADPAAPHPDEILAVCPAGTVIIYNAHLWHGGTTNRSGGRRRLVHGYYLARDRPHQFGRPISLRPEVAARIPQELRTRLEV
jgi:hypothetical protein